MQLVHRAPGLTARDDIIDQVRREQRIADLAGWELESVHGAEHLEEVTLTRATGERMRVRARGVVVKIARRPRSGAVSGQLDLDRTGAIIVDGHLRTSTPGVFAAGDVVADAYARVAAALGQGSLAARHPASPAGTDPTPRAADGCSGPVIVALFQRPPPDRT